MTPTLGKDWRWPTDDELSEWTLKVTARDKRMLSPGNTLLLIRAVRSQRRAIEKQTKIIAIQQERIDYLEGLHAKKEEA